MQPRPKRPPPIEGLKAANRGKERLLRDVLSRGLIVNDQVRGPKRLRPVRTKQGLDCRGRSCLGITHPGPLMASDSGHSAATIRTRLIRKVPGRTHTLPTTSAIAVQVPQTAGVWQPM